jgi:hypothetical protein
MPTAWVVAVFTVFLVFEYILAIVLLGRFIGEWKFHQKTEQNGNIDVTTLTLSTSF